MPDRRAAIGRPTPGKTNTLRRQVIKPARRPGPGRPRPAPPTPPTPSTNPAAARKGQAQRHDDAAAKDSLARRSAGSKTLAASPNFATMNRETERSSGESLSPREAGDGSLVLRSRDQDLYSRARGVQSVIDGRLPNVDERSISSATGLRSRLKRPPAVRRSQPPGASRASATGSTACPVGERDVGPLHRCDPTLRSVAARPGWWGTYARISS